MSFVTDAAWWRASLECCKRFAPRCYLPAGIFTAANIGLLIAYNVVFSHLDALKDTQKPTVIDSADSGILQLLGMLIAALLGAMGALSALMVSLVMWMQRLHIFARAYGRMGTAAAAADFDEATAFLKGHQKFSLVFWLVATGYLLVPSLFVTAFIGAKILMRPEFAAMFDPPPGFTRPQFSMFCDASSSIFLFVILAYTFVGFVFGSLANTNPVRLATDVVMEMLRHPIAPFALTLLVCVVNGLLVLPFSAAVFLFPSAQLESNWLYILVSQVWLGVTSTIVWPLSLAPFCKITRHAESN